MTKKMAAGGKASSFRDMTAGSGSGLGRLQKTSIASKTVTQKLKKGGIARMDKGGKSSSDNFDITQNLVEDKRTGKLVPKKYDAAANMEGSMSELDRKIVRGYDKRDAGEKRLPLAKVGDFLNKLGNSRAPDQEFSAEYDRAQGEREADAALAEQGRVARTNNAIKYEGGIMGMEPGYYKRRSNGKLERDSRYGPGNMAKGGMTKMAKGGKAEAFEGSAMDMAQDKKLAKKYGMSKKDYEKSAIDAKHDKQRSMKGLKMGGMTKMAMGGYASGGMSTAQDGMKDALRPKPTAMAKGGKAEMHDKGCKCMACGGKAKYAKGGKVTFGSMQPLPGTKTVGPIRPTTATGASMKKDGMKGQLRAKASGAKPTNMMKPLGMTKMASGGKVRGTGIAQRGTKFIGEV